MLTNSFQHIPGIGAKTERQLWASGLLNWQQITPVNACRIPPRRFKTIATAMLESYAHLNSNNPAYFARMLPAGEHWRFFPEFRRTTAFIDIETTGLSRYEFEITTMALYDGRSIKYYIQGQNLDAFMDDIQNYTVIVTYNGKTFDVPFIEAQFDTTLNHAHIDLRYVLKRLGYAGGLKRCEKALGLDRGDLDGIDGSFAVLLWHDFQRNRNEKALETLLSYNIEDVVNLEILMVMAYNMNIRETPFTDTHALSLPKAPEIPFKPDMATIEKMKQWWAVMNGGG